MSFQGVQDFVREASRCENTDALNGILGEFCYSIGFQFYAVRHHERAISHDAICLTNYPISWTEKFWIGAFLHDDPVVAACRMVVGGFLWSDIPRLVALSEDQKKLLTDYRAAGLGEGFTVPVYVPGECAGSCSFVVRLNAAINMAVLPMAQYVGCVAFEAARRLRNSRVRETYNRSAVSSPHLSSRQLDCIALVAQGKSDTDAGQLLGISNQTVHQHIETAKRRYGVATRTQLVVHALFDKHIVFQDILHH